VHRLRSPHHQFRVAMLESFVHKLQKLANERALNQSSIDHNKANVKVAIIAIIFRNMF
jgi:hypothetical protein